MDVHLPFHWMRQWQSLQTLIWICDEITVSQITLHKKKHSIIGNFPHQDSMHLTLVQTEIDYFHVTQLFNVKYCNLTFWVFIDSIPRLSKILLTHKQQWQRFPFLMGSICRQIMPGIKVAIFRAPFDMVKQQLWNENWHDSKPLVDWCDIGTIPNMKCLWKQ